MPADVWVLAQHSFHFAKLHSDNIYSVEVMLRRFPNIHLKHDTMKKKLETWSVKQKKPRLYWKMIVIELL